MQMTSIKEMLADIRKKQERTDRHVLNLQDTAHPTLITDINESDLKLSHHPRKVKMTQEMMIQPNSQMISPTFTTHLSEMGTTRCNIFDK